MKKPLSIDRININTKGVKSKLEASIYNAIISHSKRDKAIIVVCIGTDRVTGDSLGPLVGMKLNKRRNIKTSVTVYGTLESPVHAMNLDKVMESIDEENNLVIAIDASLGRESAVGDITVGQGSLKPGAGIGKDLKEVGDISITGVVNIAGLMELLVLQNTRLSFIFDMASIIEVALNNAIERALIDIEREKYAGKVAVTVEII